MVINRRGFCHKRVHVCDADHHLDIAAGEPLRDFNLVQIARGIVINRRPEQVAQVRTSLEEGNARGGRELMSASCF